MTEKSTSVNEQHADLTGLFQEYVDGRLGRRDFMKRAAALGVAGAAATALGPLGLGEAEAAQAADVAAKSALKTVRLDVAEWSYMWVNVKRADTARGSVIGGQQMYVEYMIPTRVRHPYPIVLVHGGGGQGLDWMGTPDGRPGWFQHLVSEGYKVYVVDRPGHGRSPVHPDLHGGIPQRPGTMEGLQTGAGFIFPRPDDTSKFRKGHKNWPGQGVPGSADVAQFIASQGGSYVVVPGAAGPGGPGGGAQANPPRPANELPNAPTAATVAHAAWREAGADLLDKIGPAIIMTHSAGGPFGLLVAEARPALVKATVIIEGAGSGFGGANRWGLSTIPVTYAPAVSDPSEIKVKWVANPEPDIAGYFLQEEPARKLPNLANTAVLFVIADSSAASPGNPGGPAFLRQAGVKIAEEYRLKDKGITGNSHMMMVETNHRQVLQPILDWLDAKVNKGAAAPAVKKRVTESTALKLADMNFFWVGGQVEKRDYGTVVNGQTFVQYLVPEVVRQSLPIVLVHGGGGQSTHYMGLDGNAGWAHYYLQAGYKVYLVDRPGHGRSPVSLDNLGPIGALPVHAQIAVDTVRSAKGTPKRWPGTTGDVGDPLLDQFVAGQNAAPMNTELMQRLWRRGGGELLEKIGPAIVQTHSAGGPFGWILADEKPNLVKALVSFEGAAGPLLGQGGAPGALVPKVRGIPMMYLTAEASGRTQGPAIVAALTQAGAAAEHISLKDRQITGNGHFAMVETNRKQVWDVVRGWIESKVPPTTSTARL